MGHGRHRDSDHCYCERLAAGAAQQEVDQRREQTTLAHDAEVEDGEDEQRGCRSHGFQPLGDELADFPQAETGEGAGDHRQGDEGDQRADPAQQDQGDDEKHQAEAQGGDHVDLSGVVIVGDREGAQSGGGNLRPSSA